MITYGSTAKGKPFISGEYDCAEDYFEFLDGKPVHSDNEYATNHWRNMGGDQNGWMGLSGTAKRGEKATAATMRLAREGWPEGAARVLSTAEQIEVPTILSIRRRGTWCDQGDEIEMQRVWSGDLDRAWRMTKKRATRAPTRVRIVLDSLAFAGEDAATMAMRGAAAVLLCDAMTAAGYSVEMRSAWQGAAVDRQFFLSVIVKSFDMPVDIGSLAATVALPSFFRALGHQWGPMACNFPAHWHGGYSVQNLDEGRFEEPNVLLFCAHQSMKSREDCKGWIKECVDTLNGINEEQQMAA